MSRRPNLILVGFMGAGKSSVGQGAAKKLDLAFVDSDVLIEAEAGKTIPDIFADEGESGFRERERRVLLALSEEEGLVVATGGGGFNDPQVRDALKASGVTVHLAAPFETLWQRVGHGQGRPLLAGDQAKQRARDLYDARQKIYALAHAQVDGASPLPQVVDAVVEVYREYTQREHTQKN